MDVWRDAPFREGPLERGSGPGHHRAPPSRATRDRRSARVPDDVPRRAYRRARQVPDGFAAHARRRPDIVPGGLCDNGLWVLRHHEGPQDGVDPARGVVCGRTKEGNGECAHEPLGGSGAEENVN